MLILSLFILSSLVAGYTYSVVVAPQGSWFTDKDSTPTNIFTAGTLLIDTEGPEIFTGENNFEEGHNLIPGQCTELVYTINKKGTKSTYIRVSFDGYWKKTFHRNIATATAQYNGNTITATSAAHYSFGGNDFVDFDSSASDPADYGFSDFGLNKTQFDPLPVSIVFTPSEGNGGNGDINDFDYPPKDCNVTVGNVIAQPSPYHPGDPYKWIDNNELDSPTGCELKGHKVDIESDNIDDDGYQATLNDGFHYKIIKNDDGNLNFKTNYPVYYVFVKGGGGPSGGQLYSYYPDPGGVKQDCNLTQQENKSGWSHIVFFYCVPPQAGLKLEKRVSVDGGTNWENEDSYPGLPADPDIQPQFKFIITNTGDVKLTNILIEDPDLPYSKTISELGIGESITTDPVFDSNWKDKQEISNENVTITIISDDWTPSSLDLGRNNYYYYQKPINTDHPDEFELEIKVCIDDDEIGDYDGAMFTLFAYFEAIQTTNNMAGENRNNWGF